MCLDIHREFLTHFSFLLFIAKLTVWNPWIPLDVRIHPIRLIYLSEQQLVIFFDPLFVTAHCRQQCLGYPPCQERKAQQP